MVKASRLNRLCLYLLSYKVIEPGATPKNRPHRAGLARDHIRCPQDQFDPGRTGNILSLDSDLTLVLRAFELGPFLGQSWYRYAIIWQGLCSLSNAEALGGTLSTTSRFSTAPNRLHMGRSLRLWFFFWDCSGESGVISGIAAALHNGASGRHS
jgi:hypothetical protein